MIFPKNFTDTVIRTWPIAGKAWLDQLPELMRFFSSEWRLQDIMPFENLSFNFAAKAYSNDYKKTVVLKIGIPSAEFIQETKALTFYGGHGCVKLLAHHYQKGGMLLEFVEPGTTLRSFFPEKDDQAVAYACQTMKKLHARPINTASDFPTIDTWFSLFDTLEIPQEMKKHVAQAKTFIKELQVSAHEQHVLHGDLHHDNMLLDSSGYYLAIDPKGVIGDAAYEVGAFMCNPAELAQQANEAAILARRLNQFSTLLNIDRQRLVKACYARIILSACWTVQDHGDWRDDVQCAQKILEI
jgi:streptomycin 6-kinase